VHRTTDSTTIMVLRRNRLTVPALFAIKVLHDAGTSAEDISVYLNRPKSTISRWLRRFREGYEVPPIAATMPPLRNSASRHRAGRRASRGGTGVGPNGAQNGAQGAVPVPLIIDCRLRFSVCERSFVPFRIGLHAAPQALVRVVLARNCLVWEVLDPGPRQTGPFCPPGPHGRRGPPAIWSRIAREIDARFPLTYPELVAVIEDALQDLRDHDLLQFSAFVRP
jgi:hypothetical protein